jgi:hypothetical protein
MVDNRTNTTPAAKIKGQALRLVQGLPITTENYSIAWNLFNNNNNNVTVKHTLFIVLTYYMDNMFRLIKESSSGPYVQIQILGYCDCVMGSHTLTYCG